MKKSTMPRLLVQKRFSRTVLPAAVPVAAIAAAGQKQAGQLKARHRAGQTLLTFAEIDPPVTEDSIPAQSLRNLRRKLTEHGAIRYRIYRSQSPLKSVDGREPIAELPPLTGWNIDYFGTITSRIPTPMSMARPSGTFVSKTAPRSGTTSTMPGT